MSVRDHVARRSRLIVLLALAGCGQHHLETASETDYRNVEQAASASVAMTSTQARHDATPSAEGGDFHFAPMVQYRTIQPGINAYSTYLKALIGDVNGDGLDDLVGGPRHNAIHVFLQSAAGTLSPVRVWRTGPDNTSRGGDFVVGDFNNDGSDELLVHTSDEGAEYMGAALLVSDGRGGLTLKDVAGLGSSPETEPPEGAWSAVDVDLDGNLDVVGYWNLRYRIMYGNGHGGFDRFESTEQFDRTPGSPIVEDVNGDGFADLANVLYNGLSSPEIVVHYHDRRSGFGPGVRLPVEIPEVMSSADLVLGRFNADPLTDVMATQFEFKLLAYRQGNGTYRPSVSFASGLFRNKPMAVDIDGDRGEDLVSVQMTSNGGFYGVYLAINRQVNGLLQAPELAGPYHELDNAMPLGSKGMAIGDLNSDGCKDVVVAADYEGLLRFDGIDCVYRAPPLPNESRFKSRL